MACQKGHIFGMLKGNNIWHAKKVICLAYKKGYNTWHAKKVICLACKKGHI